MTVESLTPINAADLLTAVKNSLNISGTQFDTTLQLYIDEVKEYLKSAGVSTDVLGSTLAVGCIARGVSDLWNYGNGDTKLSEYFYQRADQLRFVKVSDTPPTPVYTQAKIIVDITDSVTGAALPNATFSITGATKTEDGYYYLEASDTVWSGLATSTGYKMQRFSFTVTDADVATGKKVIPVALTAN